MPVSFKFTEIPPFTIRDEDALLFNEEGSLEYYIPEAYFGSGKSTSASIEGAYVKLMGSFNYRILREDGTPGKLMLFNFPTIFMCKPSSITKVKDVQLDPSFDPDNYRILTFKKGDQLISRCHVDQNIDNMSELFRLHIRTGRIPNSIPYNVLYQYPFECMQLNSGGYSVHSQAMGLLYSKICRDPDDISRPFRLSEAINNKLTGYKTMSIKEAAKYISPFASLTSENIDESIMSAVLLSDEEKSGKRKHTESPLEKIITM